MAYHGGMAPDARKKVQDDFMTGEKGIVCATIAFAMGIDRSNIRIVAHLYFAQSLEAYSQEVGRAGRDGLPSNCFLFLCNSDLAVCPFSTLRTCVIDPKLISCYLDRSWKASSAATRAQSRPSSPG
jgi:superfamily II DNA helicase RecQ